MRLGRDFSWLWSAYAISTFGTWLAFGAFPLVAVRVLHVSALAVSVMEAGGLAAAALLALPLGPWVEHHRKRPVMVAMDGIRFVAMASVPLAYLVGVLSYPQLLIVSILSGTAAIAFTAASGAYLKHSVAGDQLVAAHGRFEGTMWTASSVGPPLGGALIGLLGPVVTVGLDALSYLLSAVAVLRIRGTDPVAPRETAGGLRWSDVVAGWRFIFRDRVLALLFLNTIGVDGLIIATAPLLAVLLLGQYHYPAWQYGLAFALPCLGGLLGSRLAPGLVHRFGRRRVLLVTGTLRAVFPLGLAALRPGLPGLVTVIVVEFELILASAVFSPVSAAERLDRVGHHEVARTLTAWNVSGNAIKAVLTVVAGILASAVGVLPALIVTCVLLLLTPALLPWRGARAATQRE